MTEPSARTRGCVVSSRLILLVLSIAHRIVECYGSVHNNIFGGLSMGNFLGTCLRHKAGSLLSAKPF